MPGLLEIDAVPAARPACGILDVTGCRWPLAEESASVIASTIFCNAPQCDGSAYCETHRKAARSAGSRELIRSTIRTAIYLTKRRGA